MTLNIMLALVCRSALTAKPADATPSPYEAAAARRKRSAGETHDEQLGEPVSNALGTTT